MTRDPEPPLRLSAAASSASTSDKEAALDMRDQPIRQDGGAYPRAADRLSHDDVEQVPSEKKTALPSHLDPSQFPDGGVAAWTVVAGGFCCLFVSFGWINCIGVFQDYYESHILSDHSPSTVSWISSLEAFTMFFCGPFIGKFYDNYGPRWLLLGGTFFHVFGLMMTSLSTQFYQFVLAQGICSPIGASMVFYPAMSTVPTWFFRRRALAFGIMAAGSSLGGVIFPIMTERLIPQVGFPWTMRISAFLILALLVISNLTVRSRIPPQPRPFRAMDFVRPFGELRFLLLSVGVFLTFLGLFLPINFIIVQGKASGMSWNLAGYLVPILNAASLFGRILPGWAGDKFGRFNTMVLMDYFSAIVVLALWIPAKSNAPIITFAALYGFGTGALVSLPPSLVAQISDVREIGVRTGAVFSVLSIGALIGNPVAGNILAVWHGNFLGMQIFAGVLMFGGASFVLASRIAVGGFDLLKRV